MKKLILLSFLAINTTVFANTTLPSTTGIPWKSSKISDYVTVDDSNNIPVAVAINVDPASVVTMVGCNGKSYNINPVNSFSCVT